jgi:hypothetical protein
VRIELISRFGYFLTESSVHDSEYGIRPRETPPETLEPEDREWMKDDVPVPELKLSNEHTPGIMDAVVSLRKEREMFEEMWRAEGELLEWFAEA